MYNLREACEHTGTIVKSAEYGWDFALAVSSQQSVHVLTGPVLQQQ